MLDYRAKALALASLGTLTIVASCDDPTLPTDLRGAGNPSVTAVMVQTLHVDDLSVKTFETATYCKLNDEKRPGFVANVPAADTSQVCDKDLSKPAEFDGTAGAGASDWYVRVVFDRLLDPSVEDLELDDLGNAFGSLAKTQPVDLKCGGVAVAYDGYYLPNGNNATWPLGPSLVVKPVASDAVAVGSKCEISLKSNVRGKGGEAVAGDSSGSFKFEIGALEIVAIDPAPEAEAVEVDGASPIVVTWNANLAAPVAPAKIKMFAAPNKNPGTADEAPDNAICGSGGTAVAAATAVDKTEMTIADSTATDAFKPGQTYRIEFESGAVATALAGGTGVAKTDAPICIFVLTPAP